MGINLEEPSEDIIKKAVEIEMNGVRTGKIKTKSLNEIKKKFKW